METFIFQKQPNASIEALNILLKESFAERIANGMNFAAANHDEVQLKDYLKDKTTFVICDEQGHYIATRSYKVSMDKKGRKYGELYHLAVSPSYRRRGLSRKLFSLCAESCREEGAEYIKSHTAINAESSVISHISEGFEIRKMFYNGGGDYYSYLFIKEFETPSYIVNMCNKMGFIKSIFTCRVRKMIYKLKHCYEGNSI